MCLFADSATSIAAWWGAIIATVVLAWDFYKWWNSGARIRLDVKANWRAMGDPDLEGKTLLIICATNFGDRPTTIEQWGFAWYANRWQWLCNKPKSHFVVKNPGRDRSPPYRLQVGERWDAFTYQTSETDELMRSGLLYSQLRCAHQERPVSKRVRSRKVNPTLRAPE